LLQTIVTSGGGKGIVSSRRDTGKVDVLKKRKNLRKKNIYINQKGMTTAKDIFFR
jgi:hypothetical protein